MRYETYGIKAWPWALSLLVSQGIISNCPLAHEQAAASEVTTVAATASPQAPVTPLPPSGKATSHAAPAPVFADFLAWVRKYQAATTPAAKAQLEPQGVALVTTRRKALLDLIVFDPEQALTLALPLALRGDLPTAVTAQLEQRISGRGEYSVLAIDQFDATGAPKTRIRYSVIINGKAYHAGVYGRRLGVTTKNELAIHGIAIDNYLAVDESPVRRLEPGETPDPKAPVGNPNKFCPICGADATRGIPVDVGGVIYSFDKDEDIQKFEAKMEAQENIIDPAISGLEPLPVK